MHKLKSVKKLFKQIKALSPIISILLTVIVAIFAGLVLYAWASGFLTTTTNKSSTSVSIEAVAFDRNDTKCALCHTQYLNTSLDPATVLGQSGKSCSSTGCHTTAAATSPAYLTTTTPLTPPGFSSSIPYGSGINTYGIYINYGGFNATTGGGWSALNTVPQHKIYFVNGVPSQSPTSVVTPVCTSQPGCHTNIHDEGSTTSGAAGECLACHEYISTTSCPGASKMLHTTGVTSIGCIACHGDYHGASEVTVSIRNVGTTTINVTRVYVNNVQYQFYVVSPTANALVNGLAPGAAVSLRVVGLAWQANTSYTFQVTTSNGVTVSYAVTSPSNLNPG